MFVFFSEIRTFMNFNDFIMTVGFIQQHLVLKIRFIIETVLTPYSN